jgi:hypothetical protein
VSDRLVEALHLKDIGPNRAGFNAPGALGARGIVFGGHRWPSSRWPQLEQTTTK